ncbi:MAG: hypothetical protein JKY48_12430 [Flavobacteriales bacterium]|nr:hypothetical protein [Flavobacteriales bacterium]
MSTLIRFLIVLTLVFATSFKIVAQVVNHDLAKQTVYEYLDELANLQLIELNTLIKPYSRQLIAKKLKAVDKTLLNKRQLKELEFYLRDFNKETHSNKEFDKRYDLFYYKDSLFSITLNPIMGGRIWNNENGVNFHRRNGGEVFGSVGKSWGYCLALHDNSEKELLQNELYLNNDPAAVYKSSGDFSDLRAGLTYAWGWGSIALLKDNFTWGNNNFGANIISNKVPSFARVELKLSPVKWLDFTYYHGWLASGVRDSSRAYTAGARQRSIDVRKYIAANFVSIKPVKHFNVSLGNSIVYSDNIQAAFFIPFAFFKSIDHVVYSGSGNFGGQNTQLFLDISSRNIKGIHLYVSVYVDEISFSRFWSKSQHSNFVSGKLGAQWSNILNKNIQLTVEYTRTNPVTYNHFVNTTTYASNGYSLGHYLRDNAQEFAVELSVKPIARLNLKASYILAQKGLVYEYLGTNTDVWGLSFLKDKRWESSRVLISAGYELFNDVRLFVDYQYRNNRGVDQLLYSPEYSQGETNTVSFGATIGF